MRSLVPVLLLVALHPDAALGQSPSSPLARADLSASIGSFSAQRAEASEYNSWTRIVDDSGITVKPRTRIPEAARQVPFDRLVKLELAGKGASVARAAAIGGSVGAGVFLGLLMLLFANLD